MNEELLINSLLVSDGNSLGLIDIILALIFPFFLSFPATFVYRKVQLSHNYSTAFIHAFFMFSSLSSIMTLIIGNNIARAFGLIGALSIIRFRNALKSPIDAVYIFWSLAIGMACGTGYYLAAVLITATISMLAIFLHFIQYGQEKHIESIVRVRVSSDNDQEVISKIEAQFHRDCLKFSKVNIIFNSEENEKTYVYKIAAKEDKHLSNIRNELNRIQGVGGIQYINSIPSLFVAS